MVSLAVSKESSRPVSRVLCPTGVGCLSFISSVCRHTALAVYPPTWSEQLSLRRFTWPYNSQDARPLCRHKAGGLLPRLLTLTAGTQRRSGGSFLLRYSTLADSFLLGSGMLCVARTFLPHRNASDRPADCLVAAKIRKL